MNARQTSTTPTVKSSNRFRDLATTGALLTMANLGHLTDEEMRGSMRQCKLPDFDRGNPELMLQIMDKREHTAFRNTLSASGLTGGAGLIPSGGILGQVEEVLDTNSIIRRLATVDRVEGMQDAVKVFVDDTSVEGGLVGDNFVPDATDIGTFSAHVGNLKTWSSGNLYLPRQLIDDSPVVVEAIMRALSRRVSRIQNRHWTADLVSGTAIASVTAASSTAA